MSPRVTPSLSNIDAFPVKMGHYSELCLAYGTEVSVGRSHALPSILRYPSLTNLKCREDRDLFPY